MLGAHFSHGFGAVETNLTCDFPPEFLVNVLPDAVHVGLQMLGLTEELVSLFA